MTATGKAVVEKAGGEHHARIGGIGAARDRGDRDRAVVEREGRAVVEGDLRRLGDRRRVTRVRVRVGVCRLLVLRRQADRVRGREAALYCRIHLGVVDRRVGVEVELELGLGVAELDAASE